MQNDKHRKQAYALRRMSKAVDRAITSSPGEIKDRAAHWAWLWSVRAGIRSVGA